MDIYQSIVCMDGADIGEENPLPMFRDFEIHKKLEDNGTLRKEEKENFGLYNGFKVLPYCMQDQLSRERRMQEYKTVVIENDLLKAVFLPEFGGRLYTLYDKEKEQDIIYRNPVFQPANLAIRGAWFSGGIEWNAGQLGHSCSTCDDVFCAKVTGENGEEFLRIYDYVRTTGVVWQIDFHLPDRSKLLYAHVKMVNAQDKTAPAYWWTNVAVREEKRVRIFSGTEEVIYIDPGTLKEEGTAHGYGHGRLPYLQALPGKDASFPINFNHSSEYFFQNPETNQGPWEAALYEDGSGFFERSTQPLRVRKMFCWGMHEGGTNWKNFLSNTGTGNYVELQAGITPTQVHGREMEPWESIEFTQAFGVFHVEKEAVEEKEWGAARDRLVPWIDHVCDPKELEVRNEVYKREAESPCGKVLHMGHGWGYIEQIRRQSDGIKPLPGSMEFSHGSAAEKEEAWLKLLSGQEMEEIGTGEIPKSWMTDEVWEPWLVRSIEKFPEKISPYIHLGVLFYENGEKDKALSLWKKSAEIRETTIAARNIACVYKEAGNLDEASAWLKRAYELSGPAVKKYVAREYLEILIKMENPEEMMRIYHDLDAKTKQDDRILILISFAAFHLKNWQFLEQNFAHPFAVIREGENQMCDLWYQYQAQKLMESVGGDEQIIMEEVKRCCAPPANIDFRLVG